MRTNNCTICTTKITTASNNPLCSMECKERWVQNEINEMDDSEAHCPICNKSLHSVCDVVYHANKLHPPKVKDGYNRTEDCNECGETFIPTNWANPNKYCSEECFGDSGQQYFAGRSE